MLLEKERELVANYGRRMSAEGLSNGTSGNLSIYDPETGLMALAPPRCITLTSSPWTWWCWTWRAM